MQISKPLLFFIFTNFIFTDSNLNCLIKNINNFHSTKSINFLQDIVTKGEKMEKKQNGRILLGLDDENAKTNFQISEQENSSGGKNFIYKFTFDISKAKFLEITYEEEKTEVPKFDGYWYKELCLTALIDFPEIVKKVAEIFCMEVSVPETFGDFLDLRVGLYRYLYQGFRFVFNKFHSNYSKSANYIFEFQLTTEKIFKQAELTDRIASTFDEKFAPEKIRIMSDINEFKTTMKSYYDQWTGEIAKDPRWKDIDKNDKGKTGLKSYLGKAFADIKDPIKIKTLLEKIENNRYSIKKEEEFKYWLHYINYLVKLYNPKPGLFFNNIQEHIGLGCISVLKKLDMNNLLESKENFDKCNSLGQHILKFVQKKLPIMYLVFNSSAIEAIIDKVKIWITEDYNSKTANFYKMDTPKFLNFFEKKIINLINQIFKSKANVIAMANKLETKIATNKPYEMAFILKFDRLININKSLLPYIREEIKNLGGIEKILHNMDIYLNFCIKINNKAFENQKNWNEDTMRFIFYGKFIDRLSYNLMIRFPDKKKYIQQIIPFVLESDDIFYQDFYYYFDIVSLRFGESFTQFDWESATDDVIFETLKNKLRRIIKELKTEINGITHFISTKDEFNDIEVGHFRNLILNVMTKQRDNLHYFKSDVYNSNISEKDEDMFVKIINEYKLIKNDEPIVADSGLNNSIIVPTPVVPKIKQKTGDILEKLLNMKGDNKNKNKDEEIVKFIKFLIDHYDYLPNEIRQSFIDCSKDDQENSLDHQCIKIYGDSSKCRKLNPALLSNNCSGYINGDNFNKCNLNCPTGFKSSKDKMCEKPEIYLLEDELNGDCKINFENIEGVCIPRCPYGWKDMGRWCEKPSSLVLDKHYHTGFLKISDGNN